MHPYENLCFWGFVKIIDVDMTYFVVQLLMVSLKLVKSVLLFLPNKCNMSWLIRLGVLFFVVVNSNVLAEIAWIFIENSDATLFSSEYKKYDNEKNNMVLLDDKSRAAIKSADLFGVVKFNKHEDYFFIAGKDRLNVTITGIVYSDILEKNILIIERSGKQNSYTVGDTISGTNAVIRKIEPQQIIIEREGSFESLSFEQKKNNVDMLVRVADIQSNKMKRAK